MPAHAAFIGDVLVLEQRALFALGQDSRAQQEVQKLLSEAVVVAGYGGGSGTEVVDEKPRAAAEALYRHAEEIFRRHLESHNRLWYLGGVGLGILVCSMFGIFSRQLFACLDEDFKHYATPLILFAGAGASVSVLMRLTKLDVVREISRPILLISGLGRPVVASTFALVVYLAISHKIVAVKLQDGVGTEGYLVLGFLCGFSERFAEDLLDRVSSSAKSNKG